MTYFKYIFVVSISYITLLSPVLAGDDLFDAIAAWERGEDEKAATLFRPFMRGNPIARPYCRNLSKRLGDKYPHEDFPYSPCDKVANQWFQVSQIIRNDNQRKKKKNLTDALFDFHSPCALRVLAQRMQPQKDPNPNKVEEAQFQLYGNSCIAAAKANACLDPLAFADLARFKSCNLRVNSEDILPKAGLFKALLAKKPVGDALNDIAKLYSVDSKSPNTTVFSLFLRSAAYFGSLEAQLRMFRDQCGCEEEITYWVSQAVEHENCPVENVDLLAYRFEHGMGCNPDFKKSFAYSKRAAESNTGNDPLPFYNYACRLEDGMGYRPRPVEALEYYQKAMECGGDDGMRNKYGLCLTNLERISEAKTVLLEAARRGHVDALQNFVASCTDPNEFAELLPICQKVAEQDDQALLLLHQMYVNLPERMGKAERINLFKQLDRLKGHLDRKKRIQALISQAELLYHFNQDGALKGNALPYFLEASKLGSPIADCYVAGFYKLSDKAEAIKYYKRSIKGGIYAGCNSLGVLLMDENQPLSDIEAVKYLRLAYANDPEMRLYAAFNLGMMHASGRGGADQDSKRAETYFREAMMCDELRLDSKYEIAMLRVHEDNLDLHSNEIQLLLAEGVESKHPNSRFVMGQVYLNDTDLSQEASNRKLGVKLIKDAIKGGVRNAKVSYVTLLILGVEGVLKPNHSRAQEILERLKSDEIEHFIKCMTPILDILQELNSERLEEESMNDEIDDASEHFESFVEVSVTLEEEEASKDIEVEKDPRILKLQQDLDTFIHKKQVKWRKVKGVMNKLMSLTSGGFKQGKGSGLRIEMGGMKSGLHEPHGANPNELKGGRLESMLDLAQEALRKHPAPNNNNVAPAQVPEDTETNQKKKKKGKQKKGKK